MHYQTMMYSGRSPVKKSAIIACILGLAMILSVTGAFAQQEGIILYEGSTDLSTEEGEGAKPGVVEAAKPGVVEVEKPGVEAPAAPEDKSSAKPDEQSKKKAARRSLKLSVGSWDESRRSASKKTDFTFMYYGFVYDELSLRLDIFNTDRTRYWINYGNVHLVKSPGFKLDYSPGLQFNQMLVGKEYKTQSFYGGFLRLNVPDIGLTVLQKSYAGPEIDFNQTFADLRICKNLDLSYYNFSNAKVVPDTYVGPKLKFNIGKNTAFHVWYGFSLVPQKPEARLLNFFGSFTF
jgi:hypothetical protein